MTIQEYARAVAEAVLMVCEESGLPDMDAEDVRESLSDIIASVPRPTAQHHDAPTCLGWWWARRQGTWEAVRVTGWGAGHADRHVAMVSRAGSYTGAVVDRWVGPLLPPDTTEPAPDVLAVKLCNCGKCCPGPLYSQHERDAAVAAEREECAKECERIVSGIGSATAAFPVRVCASQIRARSAKGVS